MARSLVVILVAALGTLSGCYKPTIDPGGFACGSLGQCPENFRCASDHRCYQGDAGVDRPTAPVCTSATPDALCERSAGTEQCNPTCNSGCTCGWCGINASGAIACLMGTPGTKKVGELCDATRASDCAPGLRCRAESCGVARCYKFCDSSADCPTAGATCSINAGTLCSLPDPGCDAVGDTGCPSGLSCYSNGSSTECACPGSAAAGADCLGAEDCIPGYACVGSSNPATQKTSYTCKKLCNTQVDCGLSGLCSTYGTFSYCL